MVGWLQKLISPLPRPDPEGDAEFIYVYLPEALQPLERGDRYEDALDAELKLAGVGYVSGGGSSLSEPLPDGRREIEWCGIDVDATDVDAARAVLQRELPSLGCPSGTQLHYRTNEIALQDQYDGKAWTGGHSRTMLHPGFGT